MSPRVYSQNQLREKIGPIVKKYNAEKAMLFGSYARNEATPESDIDVLIYGGDKFHPTDVFSIAEEIYIVCGKNADVYEIREINPNSSFYKTITKDAVLL